MPTKYTQNMRNGMYFGTRGSRDFSSARCNAPKTANGMAKHKLFKATILSSPRAWAISLFAAHRPITSSARPAVDIEKAVRESSKNAARLVGCMDLPNHLFGRVRSICARILPDAFAPTDVNRRLHFENRISSVTGRPLAVTNCNCSISWLRNDRRLPQLRSANILNWRSTVSKTTPVDGSMPVNRGLTREQLPVMNCTVHFRTRGCENGQTANLFMLPCAQLKECFSTT